MQNWGSHITEKEPTDIDFWYLKLIDSYRLGCLEWNMYEAFTIIPEKKILWKEITAKIACSYEKNYFYGVSSRTHRCCDYKNYKTRISFTTAVVSEKKGTFICEIVMERYIYAHNTQKQQKITNYFRNKSFLEFYLVYNGVCLKLLGSIL